MMYLTKRVVSMLLCIKRKGQTVLFLGTVARLVEAVNKEIDAYPK